ncbi:unnamed protein product [Schistosoma curassoni]|uniref:RRM domain-containing protein n=1 Tax=Schistosoma curassoni TaxID=6186 RepID=A0A183KR18_9TREM|nr:unnamed protein product [Schistosoma curassoni]
MPENDNCEKTKTISIYRRVIFVEFESPSAAENVITSENGKMFQNSYVSIRSPQPWDLMVAGDLVTKYEVPTSSEANKEAEVEVKDENASNGNVHTEVEEVKKLITHIKYLDKDELWTLYNALQDMRNERGAKTKVKTLPSGRPWLDSIGKTLFTERTETLHKLELEDSKINRRRFIQCDKLYTEASNECEKAWFNIIDQEISTCNAPILPEGFQVSACFVMQFDDFLNVCPIHFRHRFIISSSDGSWFVLSHSRLLLMISGQWTFTILRYLELLLPFR